MSKLLTDTAAAQQLAAGVLADELERHAAVEMDPDVFAGVTFEPLDLEWDSELLTALAEPVDLSEFTSPEAMDVLSQSLADIDAEYHKPRPVYIPIGDDPPSLLDVARAAQRRLC